MSNLLTNRFRELSEQLDAIAKTERETYIGSSLYSVVDDEALLNWIVKAKNLLIKTCGIDSQHFMHFTKAEQPQMYEGNVENYKRLRAVFMAAREDFEGGYLVTMRNLVQADVFGSELEQARELLSNRYDSAAAVISDVVLETTIRDLCTRHGIPHAKLDKMNADLTKAGVYNGIMQKRITYLAAVRNSAAHGNKREFESHDVGAMIDEVERFLAVHLT